MTDNIIQVAETIQTASFHPPSPSPSPEREVKPKRPEDRHRVYGRRPSASDHGDGDGDAASISTDVVDPSRAVPAAAHRRRPPMPDLRFEQSYLASLRGAETWGRVAWITVRDQVLLPLIQGTLWTLALSGLRHWNRGARVSGRKTGTAVRQLWWRLTNWQPGRS